MWRFLQRSQKIKIEMYDIGNVEMKMEGEILNTSTMEIKNINAWKLPKKREEINL